MGVEGGGEGKKELEKEEGGPSSSQQGERREEKGREREKIGGEGGVEGEGERYPD